MQTILIYTDGSCYYKTKEGGFAVYITNTGRAIKKGYSNTTTARMEIMAVLTAIRQINNVKQRVIIKLDNEYVVKTIREGWITKWENENWADRKNSDLWKQVSKEIKSRPLVTFRLEWIRGHQKDLDNPDTFYNNLVDKLCDYKNFKNRTEDVDNS